MCPERLRRCGLGLLVAAICGCGAESPGPALSVELPGVIRRAVSVARPQSVRILIDGQFAGEAPVGPDGEFTLRIPGLSARKHRLQVEYVIDGVAGQVVVARLRSDVEFNVSAGETTSVDISESQFRVNLDDDCDCVSNLREVILGSSAIDSSDRPGLANVLLVPDHMATIQDALDVVALREDADPACAEDPTNPTCEPPAGGQVICVAPDGNATFYDENLVIESSSVRLLSAKQCPEAFAPDLPRDRDVGIKVPAGGGDAALITAAAPEGGQLRDISVQGFVFLGSRGTGGPGIALRGVDQVSIKDNAFVRNGGPATADGGAIQIVGGNGITIEHNLFIEARANRGGAVALLDGPLASVVNENTFVDNEAGEGSQLYFTGSVVPQRNIFVYSGDVLPVDSPASNGSVQDNLFWAGGAAADVSGYGSGNIVADPAFVDPENDDFRLQAGSPGKDPDDPEVDRFGAYAGDGEAPIP